MAKQTIALGTAPTGVGGDTPRSAFTKSQANFDELYAKFINMGFDAPASLVSVSLNSVDTFGFYYVSTPTNAPTSEQYGWLLVQPQSTSYISQTFTSAQTSLTYTRCKLNGTWGAWSKTYNATNILGTTSVSGGVPTGSIFQQGNNANGYYVRFADGTQICATLGPTIVPPTGVSNVWWTFPIAFASIMFISLTPNIGVGQDARSYVTCGTYNTLTSTQCNFSAYTLTSVGCYAYAIGRWY